MATRAQAVAVAESYIGCRTGDKRHRKLVDTFNSVKPHGEVGNYHCYWCAITWTAIMIQIKMDRTKTAYSYNCGRLISDSKAIGIWVENDAYVPRPGDGIIYYWSDSGKGDCTSGASHVGIVQKVEKGYIYVIEGNKGSGYCGVRAIKVNSRYIRGFMVPKYSDNGKFETTKLDVDGSWGTMTTLVSQKVFGTYADGVISQQGKSDKKYCPNCESSSWEWLKNPKGGSSLVKAIQKMLGVKVDGFMGKKTIKMMQILLEVEQTGKLDKATVKAWQKYINIKLTGTPGEKLLVACKEQAVWMRNYTYGWRENPTVENSKDRGTCVTEISVALQRIKILKPGQAIWHIHGKVDGANSKMKVTYPGGTLKSLKDKIKPGDIFITGDKDSMEAGGNSHIFAATGKWNDAGDPYIYDNNSASRAKQERKLKHTISANSKVIAMIRLK